MEPIKDREELDREIARLPREDMQRVCRTLLARIEALETTKQSKSISTARV